MIIFTLTMTCTFSKGGSSITVDNVKLLCAAGTIFKSRGQDYFAGAVAWAIGARRRLRRWYAGRDFEKSAS